MEPNCFSQVRLPGSEMGREVGLVEPQGGTQSEGVGYWKSGCWHLEKGAGDRSIAEMLILKSKALREKVTSLIQRSKGHIAT